MVKYRVIFNIAFDTANEVIFTEILNRVLYKLHLKKRPHPPAPPKESIPEPVKEVLEAEGLDTSSVIFSIKTDMTAAEEYGDSLIFFDEKGIYVAHFRERELPKKSRSRHKKPDLKPGLLKLVSIPIDEIDELFAEQYLATGQLTYTFNGEYFSLGFFSIGLLERADNFRKIFNAFKKEREI